MAQFFNLQKQSAIHDKYTTGKIENKITATLSRNEINALQTYIMLWEHTSKIHKKKLWRFLQVKSMAV
jgi:hypothetical protein